uniref:DNA-directed RNA polymerase subunit alpha n=4 Tax=Pyrrosia TaxID=156491 RepID=A0A6M4B8L5_9MONI|nr:RNA polymerase alpha subunit [Pyrrosia bonii]YP_009774231.1 RNA polymerase subunit alpha [Pyrrosia subfurfuracea]QJQ36632.1 RNA polymerase alpha subunit [Pyrrosia sheareri]QJQ36983.1 RNA polymerase alpha subunit [Pyrrosia drakeana]AZA06639.1 RNA polymerase alpha subunit [Pyrrosia bonii]QIZ74842.1 RNA polymerase subunit alpha [Pyrrosia subfurfuracea]
MLTCEKSICTQAIQLKCIESRVENKRLHYGRFVVSPFKKGQASTVGIAMRRALLEETRGTSITCARFHGVVHEYSTVAGIKETIHDVLVNLKEVALTGDSDDVKEAISSVTGPKEITAGDISFPPSVKPVDNLQHIVTVTQPISVTIELKIEKDCGYRIKSFNGFKNGEFPADAVFMPVRNVNYSVHLFGSGKATREISLIEIWTNGSPTPDEAISEASEKLIELSSPFLHVKKRDVFCSRDDKGLFSSIKLSSQLYDRNELGKKLSEDTFIDQLGLPARAFNCLKEAEIHTVADLLNYSREDLSKIKSFGQKSVDQVSKALWERFASELSQDEIHIK